MKGFGRCGQQLKPCAVWGVLHCLVPWAVHDAAAHWLNTIEAGIGQLCAVPPQPSAPIQGILHDLKEALGLSCDVLWQAPTLHVTRAFAVDH